MLRDCISILQIYFIYQIQHIMPPIFTRYLYEFNHVKHSLLESIREKQREESLFWAYELYHSGFQEEVWQCVRGLYSKCSRSIELRFDKFYAEWKATCDACLLGTVVGTLAVWEPDPEKREEQAAQKPTKKIIILYKEDRHQNVVVNCATRNYLKLVSRYSLRGRLSAAERDAYLGPYWLYYCAKTPLWESRIQEGGGKIFESEGEEGRIEFETDDLLEAFYERWGFEPDEQSLETHQLHGI